MTFHHALKRVAMNPLSLTQENPMKKARMTNHPGLPVLNICVNLRPPVIKLYFPQNRINSPPSKDFTSRSISAGVTSQPVSARSAYLSVNTLAMIFLECSHL